MTPCPLTKIRSFAEKANMGHSGNSTAIETLTALPPPTTAEKWNALPQGAKIGIYAAAGAVGASLIGLISFCCIKQRRAGRREQAAYAARLETERREQEAYQMENKSPDALTSTAPTPSEYTKGATGGGFTKAGAAGFGSGGYTAPAAVPPMPAMPTAYGMGGVPSPNVDAYHQSTGGFPSPGMGGYAQNTGSFNTPSTYYAQNAGGYSNPNQSQQYGYFGAPQGYSNNANNGYSRQGDRW
jgi:hypothetical protein